MDKQQELIELLEDKVHKATSLRLMVDTDGWGILLETFQDMKENQLAQLSEQVPGNEKAILAAHAVWYAVVHTLDQIVFAVNSAISEGEAARRELELTNTTQEEDWS